MSEVRIQCHEDAARFDCESPNLVVGRTAEPDSVDRDGIVPGTLEDDGLIRRQVLVEEEFHARAKMSSSLASWAAY